MSKEIIEGNKLIAEFMGGKVEQFVWRKYEPMGVSFAEQVHGLQAHLLHDLEYHASWDWLMPVVEKIEDTEIDEFKVVGVNIEENECEIKDYRKGQPSFAYYNGETKIESVWQAVIQFITWYNQQNT